MLKSDIKSCPFTTDLFFSRVDAPLTPVDMLAIEVANVQTGVWERRDGLRNESRAWRFSDFNDSV